MRSSVFLEIKSFKNENKVYLIFDCGNDFREQALAVGMWDIAGAFISDSQCGNCMGIDDVRPFTDKNRIGVWCNESTVEALKKKFNYVFNIFQIGGGLPKFNLFSTCPNKPITIDLVKDFTCFFLAGFEGFECENGELLKEVSVVPFECYNKRRKSNGYRVGNFAYLPDCKVIPDESFDVLKGVSILLVECTGIRERKNRMNIEDALKVIIRVGAKHNVLTRFTHDNTNDEIEEYLKKAKAERKELEFADIKLAYDGMRIDKIEL